MYLGPCGTSQNSVLAPADYTGIHTSMLEQQLCSTLKATLTVTQDAGQGVTCVPLCLRAPLQGGERKGAAFPDSRNSPCVECVCLKCFPAECYCKEAALCGLPGMGRRSPAPKADGEALRRHVCGTHAHFHSHTVPAHKHPCMRDNASKLSGGLGVVNISHLTDILVHHRS